MSLEQEVMKHLKEAMLTKNEISLNALRAIKSAILLEKTSGKGGDLDVIQEANILQKLLKQRQDALAIYTAQNREDLAKKEQQEIEIITAFLPKQVSEEEALRIIEVIIKSSGANSIKDMGKVMGLASAELAGRIDNKKLSDLIKRKLV